MSKPIKIVRVSGGFNMFVNNVPVVMDGKGVTVDRQKVGLKVKRGYKPPASEEPALIPKASDAAGLAHQIGRYLLDLGDFTFSYTELVGVPGNHEDWWSRASQ